jgi:hypothetical protein
LIARSITAVFCLTAGPVLAEQILLTEMPCLPGAMAVGEFAIRYREEPLWGGGAYVMALDPSKESMQPTGGPVFFTVNQNTGTWSLFFGLDADTVCLLASGTGFTPE